MPQTPRPYNDQATPIKRRHCLTCSEPALVGRSRCAKCLGASPAVTHCEAAGHGVAPESLSHVRRRLEALTEQQSSPTE